MRFARLAPVLILASMLALTVHAAAPDEVTGLVVGADDESLSWNSTSGATRYNVYRGTAADGSDLGCLVLRTPDLTATDSEVPVATSASAA